MRRGQFLTLCIVAFAGCFLGGFLAQAGPQKAWGQLREIPPGDYGQMNQNIRNSNQLFVPSGGLRMVDERNRVIGMILNQPSGAGLVLLDGSGRPSVSLLAGGQGQIALNTNANAVIRVSGPAGKDGFSATATDSSVVVKMLQGLELTAANDGGRIFVSNAKGGHGVRIDTTADGGRVTGFDKDQRAIADLSPKGGTAILNLFGKEAKPGFSASGDGSAAVTKGEETLWKVPKDEGTGGGGTLPGGGQP